MSTDIFGSLYPEKSKYSSKQCPTIPVPGSLKKHQRTHSGETPYHCKEWPNKFSPSVDPKSHSRNNILVKKVQRHFNEQDI